MMDDLEPRVAPDSTTVGYVPEHVAEPVEDAPEQAVQTALQRIPTPARLALYAGYALAGPVLIYLSAKGLIGPDEWMLYAGLGTVLGVTASGNVTR